MADNYAIHGGTVSQGLWTSPDGGASWMRVQARGLGDGSSVRGLAVCPDDPHTILPLRRLGQAPESSQQAARGDLNRVGGSR